MLNCKRNKAHHDWYNRTGAPTSSNLWKFCFFPAGSTHICTKIQSHIWHLSMFILQRTDRCWHTYQKQLSHILKCLQWLLCCLTLAAAVKRNLLLSVAEPTQASWPHASSLSAALPWRAAEPHPLRRRDRKEQQWEEDLWLCTQASCCWLIHPIQWQGRNHGEVLRSVSFEFPALEPSRYCTTKYLFPDPSRLFTSCKAYRFWRQ